MAEVGRCAVLGVVLAVGAGGLAGCAGRPKGSCSLEFDDAAYAQKDASVKVKGVHKTVRYRLYSGIPYVAKPVDVGHQNLSVRVPVSVDGKRVDSAGAPILLDNSSSGEASEAADAKALASGFVVVTSAVRGDAWDGIVDLKAAVRYVRRNKGRLPGDVDRIVATGSGAGGGLAALLGASAGRGQYDDALDGLGAAEESDRVHAVAASGPVTEIGKADLDFDRHWFLTNYLEPSATRFLKGLPEGARALYLKRNPWITWMGGRISFGFGDFLGHVGAPQAVPGGPQAALGGPQGALGGAKRKPVLWNAMDFVRQRNPARARHWWLRAGTDGAGVPLTVVGSLAAGLESLGDDVDATIDWNGTPGDAAADGLVAWITRTVARRSQ
ncbi:hypothetical protein [Actinomadura rupiterrae]|uniref:hypothetical protein n=1 Tax=Actinomadura rupiterrae TaxID=559627 RepID=UPI0020A55B49|nr:hypothetical protein [Actinomadura rupiterrae]MCP2335343.1 hypothetical protein [Actinomadura rupiterrae]